MTPSNAFERLRAMLDAAGFDRAAPRLDVAWPVWRAWIATPVEGMDPDEDADMVSYETIRQPSLQLSFTRQFMHYEDGEYTGMVHLFLSLDFPADQFEGVPATQFWGVPGPRSGEWIAAVERDPAFMAALERTPLGCEIEQDPV